MLIHLVLNLEPIYHFGTVTESEFQILDGGICFQADESICVKILNIYFEDTVHFEGTI